MKVKPLGEIILMGAWFLAMACLSSVLDRDSAVVTDKIVKASPKPITHYTITQDSPGLSFYERRGYERAPLPLTHPLEKK